MLNSEQKLVDTEDLDGQQLISPDSEPDDEEQGRNLECPDNRHFDLLFAVCAHEQSFSDHHRVLGV
jgi:hypothetical protein